MVALGLPGGESPQEVEGPAGKITYKVHTHTLPKFVFFLGGGGGGVAEYHS